MRAFITVAFIAIMMSPQLLECITTCQVVNPKDRVEGHCPVNITATCPGCPDCVTVRVWIKTHEFSKFPKIDIKSSSLETITPKLKNKKCPRKIHETPICCGRDVSQPRPHRNASLVLWELVHDCVNAETPVVVSYSTKSTSCNVTFTLPEAKLKRPAAMTQVYKFPSHDPVPDFELSVNHFSKSITVTVEPGHQVRVRWCYQKRIGGSPLIDIDPSKSRSANLTIPYLLPCVCVEVFYKRRDARRNIKCPFRNQMLSDVKDVWDSSEVTMYKTRFVWKSKCPDLNISASLCWRQQEHSCIPVSDSTLQSINGALTFNTSAVDKHPQMCVKLSLQGSHNISCQFQADESSWEVDIGLGRQSLFLYLTSLVPAKFSAQLCVLHETGCAATGEIYSLTMNGNNTDAWLKVPLRYLAERPCVQVWRLEPFLHGRRILCPDYTHYRYGLYTVAALIFLIIITVLGISIHCLTRRGTAGWLHIQKPVLLLCSSEQSAHVSAACALASILKGDLSATVRMALWALNSQIEDGVGIGVADLGPLPWLYGQWEAVCKDQGKVLIVWSPEAKKVYEEWREETANMHHHQSLMEERSKVKPDKVSIDLDLKLNGRRMGKYKKEKAAGQKDCTNLSSDPQREPSTVTAVVFKAALACLEGALQSCKAHRVVLVYFQGFCHSKDIPKALRSIPRYCLPQDIRGLIQELGGMRRQTEADKFRWHCWPRLLTKVLSIWLARQLAQRLKTLLPQTHRKTTHSPGVTSSMTMISDKSHSGLKLPLAAKTSEAGTVQEHKPLHEPPCGEEKL
ncbi:uncharacterized protein V6R79_026106 [Siganus canaliculatus]